MKRSITEEWQKDPAKFIEEVLGEKLCLWQRTALTRLQARHTHTDRPRHSFLSSGFTVRTNTDIFEYISNMKGIKNPKVRKDMVATRFKKTSEEAWELLVAYEIEE